MRYTNKTTRCYAALLHLLVFGSIRRIGIAAIAPGKPVAGGYKYNLRGSLNRAEDKDVLPGNGYNFFRIKNMMTTIDTATIITNTSIN